MPMSRSHKQQIRGTKLQGTMKPLTASPAKKNARMPKQKGARKR